MRVKTVNHRHIRSHVDRRNVTGHSFFPCYTNGSSLDEMISEPAAHQGGKTVTGKRELARSKLPLLFIKWPVLSAYDVKFKLFSLDYKKVKRRSYRHTSPNFLNADSHPHSLILEHSCSH